MSPRFVLWPWVLEYTIQHITQLEFGKRTKATAFADDLLIAVRVENVRESENFANIEVNKITKWGEENKITFSEQKSKVMVVTREREKKAQMYIYTLE
jgi:hypothetical protein